MSELPIPIEALEDAGIVLGRRGAGKSNALMVLFEHELDAGHRAVMVDPKGDRWGVRMNPDGSPSRFDIPIFGGEHGDLPVTAEMGETLGRLVAGHDLSCLIDLSLMSLSDKQAFMMGFAPELLQHNRAALTLFIEEVDQFANQDQRYQPPMLVHHIANFSTLGRQRGIVPWVASQRPAKVNATVRAMADTFVGMKVTGPLDREAYRDWFKGHSKEAAARVDVEVGRLTPGQALVWVGAAEFFDQVQFPMASTYDSGRTPKHGETVAAVTLPKIDLSSLQAALAVAGVPADYPDDTIPADPKAALKKGGEVGLMLKQRDDRIAALEVELAQATTNASYWHRCCASLVERLEKARALIGDPHDYSPVPDGSRAKPGVETAPPDLGAAEPVSRRAAARTAAPPPSPRPSVRGAAGDPEPLNKTATDVAGLLRAIAPDSMKFDDALLMLGRRPGSGDAGKAMKGLTAHGYVEVLTNGIAATQALLERGDIPLGSYCLGEELVAQWEAKLRGPGGDILRDLFTNGPATKEQIGERLGKSPTSGWFGKGMKDLRRSNIVTERGRELHLHPFFEPAR